MFRCSKCSNSPIDQNFDIFDNWTRINCCTLWSWLSVVTNDQHILDGAKMKAQSILQHLIFFDQFLNRGSRLISKLLNRRSWGWASPMKGATWVMLTWTAMLLGSNLSSPPMIFLNDPKMQVLAFVSSGPMWRPHSARGVKTLTGWGKSSRWLKRDKDKCKHDGKKDKILKLIQG